MIPMRSLALATADALGSVLTRQTVYVFPGQQFDPNCVRLVTRGRDPATAVACLLGFFKLVCEDGYEQVSQWSAPAHVDGVWLDEVHVSGAFVRRQLRALNADSEPAATMDDFYVLLGVLLCNLPRARGSNLNRDWFQNRVNDLVELFPGSLGAPLPCRCTARSRRTPFPTSASSGPTPGRHSATHCSGATSKCVFYFRMY
ncbi:hypothetical protein MTO96_002202 [Rhipicephalus appendiculatus]